MDNDLVSKRRAERCTTHSHACDCREYAHAQEITRKDAEIAELRARIADAETAVIAKSPWWSMTDLVTRLQRLSGQNPVARLVLTPDDWPEIERMISVSELRIVAKQNLRSMIVLDSADKKLMLACLEELQ